MPRDEQQKAEAEELVITQVSIATAAASLVPPDGGAYTPEHLAALRDEAATRVGTGTVWQTAVRILSDRQPQFFYFGDYQTLPGRIDVRALVGSDLLGTTPLQTARALLELAGTTAEALTEETSRSARRSWRPSATN